MNNVICENRVKAIKSKVPVYKLPMMSDEAWEAACLSSAKLNLASVNISCTDGNIKGYFAELRAAEEYLKVNQDSPYQDKELFPILSVVFGN